MRRTAGAVAVLFGVLLVVDPDDADGARNGPALHRRITVGVQGKADTLRVAGNHAGSPDGDGYAALQQPFADE